MLRRLEPAEASVWRNLRTVALATAPAAFAGAPGDWADMPLAAVAAEIAGARVFVWEEGGRTLAGGQWVRDRDAGAPGRGWVEAVFVRPEARGRGLAAALLAELARDAAAAGMRELWLEVGLRNRAARAVYLKAGFRAPPPGGGPAASAPGELALVRFLPVAGRA